MNVISSGKDYYEKLTALSERLHIQQHDYKYHLNALSKMLACGYTESSQSYLDKLNKKTSENQIKEYCGSRVINALLDSFAERCANENINFIVSSYLPDKRNLNDYELCVILGNLLENALTACLSLESERIIELRIKLQGDSLGITVKNSFNGDVTVKDGAFVSRKENGGSGIKSIQSILNRYGGDFVPKWDKEFFTVFVVVDITK
jgi:sensor histidine kinase regulating citrate/malate metabolism